MNSTQRPHGQRWYLIHAKSRQEGRALENLHRQGFECFRPMRAVERCRDGRTCKTAEPLFPGYLFIRLDCQRDNWSSISSTRGVHRIVRFNDYPLAVTDELIEGIRARLAAGSSAPEPYLKPGERVQITQGAFSQIEAIFLLADGDERVVLLLNVLQSEQKLSFPLRAIRKVG